MTQSFREPRKPPASSLPSSLCSLLHKTVVFTFAPEQEEQEGIQKRYGPDNIPAQPSSRTVPSLTSAAGLCNSAVAGGDDKFTKVQEVSRLGWDATQKGRLKE